MPNTRRRSAVDEQTKPPARVAFATNLKTARRRRHRYQKDMAKALGIEPERYRTWERAEREPDITNLAKIAVELDVSLDFLICGIIPALRPKRP